MRFLAALIFISLGIGSSWAQCSTNNYPACPGNNGNPVLYDSIKVNPANPVAANGSLLSVAPSGGPTSTVLQLSPATFNATGYGSCVWDQATGNDVSSCINAAIAAAGAAAGGGHVIVPSGRFSITSEILNNVNGVVVEGQGHNNGVNPTTSLVWHGGVGGTMAQLGVSFSGAAIWGSGFSGIYFDCNVANSGGNGQARRGLYAVNAWYSTIDLFVEEPYVASPTTGGLNAVAFDIDANVNYSTMHLAWSMQAQTLPSGAAIAPVNTYTVDQLPYPAGLFLHSDHVNAAPNTSYTYIDIYATQAVGVPVEVDWSDHVHFGKVLLFEGAGPYTSLLAPFLFNNANTADGAAFATSQDTVDEYSALSGIVVEGSGTNISAATGIIIKQYDYNNGTPAPTYNAGSSGWWADDNGILYNLTISTIIPAANNLTFGDGLTQQYLKINSGASGSGIGACLITEGAGTAQNYFGTKSGCAGGSFNPGAYINSNEGEIDLAVFGTNFLSAINAGIPYLQVSEPFYTNSGAPTIASGACGATTNGAVAGDNQSGKVTIGSATTAACAVGFSATQNQAPHAVVLTPANAAAAALGAASPYVSALSSAGFTFSAAALADTTWYYHVY